MVKRDREIQYRYEWHKDGLIMDKEVSEADRHLKPENVIFGDSLTEIELKMETHNIIYLARADQLKEYRDKGIKLVERGTAGPVMELGWCLLILTTDNIKDAYREFLKKMEALDLIDKDQIHDLEDPYYSRLPNVREEVRKM